MTGLLLGLALAGDPVERPPPSYLWSPMVAEVRPLGPAIDVAKNLEAMDVSLDRIGWGHGLLVGPEVQAQMVRAQPYPGLIAINQALKHGEVECAVWVQNNFGSHRGLLYGNCHPGSGEAYLRRARTYRGLAALCGVLGGAGIAAGAAMMSNDQTFLGDQWWGGLFLASAGAGLVVSTPLYLGIAHGMSRYGRQIQSSR